MLKKICILFTAVMFALPLCIAHVYSMAENQNEESIQQTVNTGTLNGLLEVQVDEANVSFAPETQTIFTELTSQNREELKQMMQEIQTTRKQEAIIAYADSFVGNPYVWGGCSLTKGCDCSHFVWLVLRDTIGYDGGWVKSTSWLSRGTVVDSLANAQPGDVIVYRGHVAFYDGNGLLIDARNRRVGITHSAKADYTTILGIRRFV